MVLTLSTHMIKQYQSTTDRPIDKTGLRLKIAENRSDQRIALLEQQLQAQRSQIELQDRQLRRLTQQIEQLREQVNKR
jgi:uncharacterized coiled-coil protein SlyX